MKCSIHDLVPVLRVAVEWARRVRVAAYDERYFTAFRAGFVECELGWIFDRYFVDDYDHDGRLSH